MKIVLCYPPIFKKTLFPMLKRTILHPPLGLGYLASSLEQAGHKVKVIDVIAMKYTNKDLCKVIKNFEPDVVGISSYTMSIFDSLKILTICK